MVMLFLSANVQHVCSWCTTANKNSTYHRRRRSDIASPPCVVLGKHFDVHINDTKIGSLSEARGKCFLVSLENQRPTTSFREPSLDQSSIILAWHKTHFISTLTLLRHKVWQIRRCGWKTGVILYWPGTHKAPSGEWWVVSNRPFSGIVNQWIMDLSS